QRNLEAELAAHPIAAELHRDAVQAHVDLVLLIRAFVERHAGLVERRAAAVRRLVAVTREGEAAWMWSVQVRGSETAAFVLGADEAPATSRFGSSGEGEKREAPPTTEVPPHHETIGSVVMRDMCRRTKLRGLG